jgi:hypothetical protein
MNRFVRPISIIAAITLSYPSRASEETIGPKGINSVATGIDGTNSLIGQVEPERPGVFGYDNAANCCNDKVVPAGVYTRNGIAGMNQGLSEHALWVASVMISKQDFRMAPGVSPPNGVAPAAHLVSAAYFEPTIENLQQDAALAAQRISPFVYATNMSFGVPLDDT